MTEPQIDGNTSYAPEQSYRWLRPFIPKRMQPMLRSTRLRSRRMFITLEEPYRTVYPFSHVNVFRQRNLVRLAEQIVADEVPGAIVECGVLDGGTAALMAWATRNAEPARPIHLYDAWAGLPEPTAEDGEVAAKWTGQVAGSPTRVLAVMNKLDIDRNRIHMHRGWFEETFPHVDVEQVAMVHIDCDFYAATKLCIDTWYPRISPGGAMQLDDYAAFSGCHQAVDEFLAEHEELALEASPPPEAYFLRKPHI